MRNRGYLIIGMVLILAFLTAIFIYSKQDESKAIGKLNFQTTDLQGEEVDSSIFANYDLTMINIWGTFCSPCVEEMPDIEELYTEMKEKKVNVIGIVSDIGYPTRSKESYEQAQNIVEELGITYRNLVPDQYLQAQLLNRTNGVPTTIFVDNEGNMIGKIIVGAQSKSQYEELINDYLNELKEGI